MKNLDADVRGGGWFWKFGHTRTRGGGWFENPRFWRTSFVDGPLLNQAGRNNYPYNPKYVGNTGNRTRDLWLDKCISNQQLYHQSHSATLPGSSKVFILTPPRHFSCSFFMFIIHIHYSHLHYSCLKLIIFIIHVNYSCSLFMFIIHVHYLCLLSMFIIHVHY